VKTRYSAGIPSGTARIQRRGREYGSRGAVDEIINGQARSVTVRIAGRHVAVRTFRGRAVTEAMAAYRW